MNIRFRMVSWMAGAAILYCAVNCNSAHAGAVSVADKIDGLFSGIDGKAVPGAAVVVMRGGEVIHSKGYGLANIEAGVPNTTRTQFRLASVTKSFTALAILRLAEEGRLSLDDPAAKYLPDLAGGDKITVRHLLSHTGGMPDFIGFEQAQKMPRDSAPGERLNYSNVGYIALGRIIEKVTGTSYESQLRKTIFAPLGMTNTGVDRRESNEKNRAVGYSARPGGQVAKAEYTDTSNDPEAGGLYSTAEDMARWMKALTTGRIVSNKTFVQATTPVRLNDGHHGIYGYGFMLAPFRGLKEIGHGGDISGFNTYVAFYPDENLAVIVLSNLGMQQPGQPSGPLPTSGDLAHRIVEIVIPDRTGPAEPEPMTVPATVLEHYVGRYHIEAPPMVTAIMGDSLEITREGQHLMAAGKQGRAELLAESPTTFYPKGAPVKIIFVTDAGGSVSNVYLSLMGLREFPMKR